MQLQTIIFYGLSGSGKGTQAVLLKKYLEEHDQDNKTLYFQTGEAVRELAEIGSAAGKLTKQVMDTGGLMPSLLVVWLWGDYFFKNLHGKEHLLLDGVARRIQEAPLFHDAMKFFKREPITIIKINVTREWAFDHLKERGRYDDTDENINRRLDWFEPNATPVLEYFKSNSVFFNFIEINGEQPIAKVHEDILLALNIKSQ